MNKTDESREVIYFFLEINKHSQLDDRNLTTGPSAGGATSVHLPNKKKWQ